MNFIIKVKKKAKKISKKTYYKKNKKKLKEINLVKNITRKK